MISQALVSIIVPAYRASTYISQTINSVLSQTYQSWELLIADDCSPDNTREVIGQWCEKDERIKLIKLTQNGGPAIARNAALEHAKGRWIAFLDSDDLWLPEKLERSLKFAQEKDAALIFTGFRRINFDGAKLGKYISVPETLTYTELLGNTSITTSTVLLDREKCGEIRMQKVFYDDFVCWLGILKQGHVAYGLNEDLVRYRVLEKSVSRNKQRSALEVWKTYRNLENLGLLLSTWSFVNYSVRAVAKYRTF